MRFTATQVVRALNLSQPCFALQNGSSGLFVEAMLLAADYCALAARAPLVSAVDSWITETMANSRSRVALTRIAHPQQHPFTMKGKGKGDEEMDTLGFPEEEGTVSV